ncbi:MAG: hypothetical protein FWD06_09600, partial [Oscillospiraceae bacterium]|nr:hypothetical protein [Oscillospiraceae bacterium]
MTSRQEQLLNSFLASLDPVVEQPLYQELAACLTALGYSPKKQRSYLVFKHELHGKQMAKMGMKKTAPFFALRFSACQNYSQTFADIISAAVAKPHYPPANCMADGCGYCSGEAATRVYTHEDKHLCGARQLE